ncbi:MAG: carbohydrate ABC transporter permease [Hyphomicrobiales bacterium]|nr:carbohydrate ABC transporter permease [Hyphomicrobiales bacterium]MDE2113373.1 carbohydrate ABC transporter permease [Hyphomicrobiales bacterium]
MKISHNVVVWGAAILITVNGFFPALWILFTALKSETELAHIPITWLPQAPTLANFISAFSEQPLLRFTLNSVIVAAGSTVIAVFAGACAAYALVRLRIPGRGLVLSTLLAVSMFPLIALMVPLFQIFRSLHLLNTYMGLILPYSVLSLPVCTLVLISFFQDIPADLENAAMIDGCSRLGALWRVVVPLSTPGILTAALLAFVNSWDEFLLALTINTRLSMRTLPVGITLYQSEYADRWPVVMAALVIAIVPVSLLIALFQDRVVGGLTQGGLKG